MFNLFPIFTDALPTPRIPRYPSVTVKDDAVRGVVTEPTGECFNVLQCKGWAHMSFNVFLITFILLFLFMSFRQCTQYCLHCTTYHTSSTAVGCSYGSFLLQAFHKEVWSLFTTFIKLNIFYLIILIPRDNFILSVQAGRNHRLRSAKRNQDTGQPEKDATARALTSTTSSEGSASQTSPTLGLISRTLLSLVLLQTHHQEIMTTWQAETRKVVLWHWPALRVALRPPICMTACKAMEAEDTWEIMDGWMNYMTINMWEDC